MTIFLKILVTIRINGIFSCLPYYLLRSKARICCSEIDTNIKTRSVKETTKMEWEQFFKK